MPNTPIPQSPFAVSIDLGAQGKQSGHVKLFVKD